MTEVRLYISVASCRDWKPQFGSSVVGMMHHLLTSGLDGRLKALDFRSMIQASNLSQAREISLREAINKNYTHWLCLDDDMVFPVNVVDVLLAHDKTVVTTNYCRKKIGENLGVNCDLDAQKIDSSKKTGLEEVGFAALGCALLRVQDLKDIPSPRFEVVWSPEREDYWSEDMVFSALMRKNNIPLWCDHDLSKAIRHVGDYEHQWCLNGN